MFLTVYIILSLLKKCLSLFIDKLLNKHNFTVLLTYFFIKLRQIERIALPTCRAIAENMLVYYNIFACY